MASLNPLACFVLGLFALSGSGLLGMHLLPSWLQGPILRLRSAGQGPSDDDGAQLAGPKSVAVLLKRLQKIDQAREPATAYTLHLAIANTLRAAGTDSKEALQHFEAARDAAVRGTDTDAQLLSHLEVAEAYIEDGRPLDSQRELNVANAVLADNFSELWSRLNRGRGRAKFELGWTEQGLQYFEEAQKRAVQPADKAHAACDIAMANACLGHADKSLEPLRGALEVLNTARKAGSDGGMPAALHSELAANVHFRLAEAFHSIHNLAFAKAHYAKALHLQPKLPGLKALRVSAIQRGLALLEKGVDPELRCPRLPRSPWDKAKDPPKKMKESAFVEKINALLAEHKYDVAEKELKEGLSTHSRPYGTIEAATALNMLGHLYRKQDNFVKAAKQYRQALTAVVKCCGAGTAEATEAFEGLRDVKSELPWDGIASDQRVAAAAMELYLDVLKKKGLPLPSEEDDSLELLIGEKDDSLKPPLALLRPHMIASV